MTFYEILKEKANNPKYEKKIVLVGTLNKTTGDYDNYLLKYKDILYLVDTFILSLKENNVITKEDIGKARFVVINNSINSVIMVLSFLKLGVIPVLLDAKNIGITDQSSLPFIYAKNADNIKDDNSLTIDLYIKNHFSKDDLEEKVKTGNVVIFSSGSEGYNPHYNILNEEDLIKLPNQYGEHNSHFYSYVSCANISGILTNLVNPIVNDCTVILNESFDINNFKAKTTYGDVIYFPKSKENEKKDYLFSCSDMEFMNYLFLKRDSIDKIYIYNNKVCVITPNKGSVLLDYSNDKFDFAINTLMFPRNILEYLKSVNPKELDFSKINKIYLTGGINSNETIEKLRTKIPSIKEGVFTNLYGSTEANGVICSCDENDLKTCYIDITKYNQGEIYYTYNREKIFKIKNGIVSKVSSNFRDFNFNAYLSVSNCIVPNVVIDGMDIIRKENNEFINTGDIGIYIDNRLYVLGRRSEFLITKEKIYDLKRIENRYSNLLGVPTYCVKDKEQEKVFLFIRYDKDNFEEGINLYEKAAKFRNMIDKELVMPPILLNDIIFPMSTISGKVSKAKLIDFSKYSKIQEKNFKEYYLDLEPERRCAVEFIKTYFSGSNNPYDQNTFFPGVKASDLDDNLCFTVKLPSHFMSVYFNRISYLFDVVSIDDANKTMKLKVLPQILFFTEEEFFKGIPVLNNNENLKKLIVTLIKENKNEIKTWKYINVANKDNYTFDDLKQLAKNFILTYIEYLKTLGFDDASWLPDMDLKLSENSHAKVLELLK